MKPNRYPGPLTYCLHCRQQDHDLCTSMHCRCADTHQENPLTPAGGQAR